MARIRTIKPSFFLSPSVADLPVDVRLTFIGLWTYVDDKGRGRSDARLVKAAVWPLDDKHTSKVVERHINELEKHGHICRYTVDGQQYIHVCKFLEHQVINRPQASKLPEAPCETTSPVTEHSVSAHGTIHEHSLPEGKGRERKGTSSSSVDTSPPPDEPQDDDEDAIRREAERRLAVVEAARGPRVDRTRWLADVEANLRNENWQPPKASAPRSPCTNPECSNGFVLDDDGNAHPCPQCRKEAA